MTRVSDGVEIPDGEPLPIKAVWAYVALDPDDDTEGIVPMIGVEMNVTPLIGADEERITALRPWANEIAKQLGVKVSLVRFSTREVLIDDILEEVSDADALPG